MDRIQDPVQGRLIDHRTNQQRLAVFLGDDGQTIKPICPPVAEDTAHPDLVHSRLGERLLIGHADLLPLFSTLSVCNIKDTRKEQGCQDPKGLFKGYSGRAIVRILQQIEVPGTLDRLRTAVHGELAIDILEMILDCIHGNHQ